MLQNKSKIETYIGFSLRAGKYRCGINAIGTLKKVNLLVLCHTAEKNSIDHADKLARKFNCRLISSNVKTIEELTGKENCKLLAILDSELTKAILDNLGEDFTEIVREA